MSERGDSWLYAVKIEKRVGHPQVGSVVCTLTVFETTLDTPIIYNFDWRACNLL
jgi:hypothetical protein